LNKQLQRKTKKDNNAIAISKKIKLEERSTETAAHFKQKSVRLSNDKLKHPHNSHRSYKQKYHDLMVNM